MAAATSGVGQRIAEARRRAGLTARDLGQAVGLTLWEVERLESGRADPAPVLDRIARAVGMPVERLRAHPRRLATARRPGGSFAGITLTDGLACWLVLGSILLLVVVRFFTEVVTVLPRAANFIDIPVLAALLLATVLARPPESRRSFGLLLPGAAFLAVCVVSVLTNLTRVDAAPALLFVYGFMGPFAVFWAVHRIWPTGRALMFSRMLVALGLLQLTVVVLIDVPLFFATENPDVISGTFGESPYQLVFFLLVLFALLAGIFTFEPERRIARAVPALLIGILVVIFMAQYRALLVTTGLTVLAVGIVLGVGRPRGMLLGMAALVALAVTLSLTARYLPFLKFGSTVAALSDDPTYYAGERLGVVGDVGRLYADDARYTLTGTGPGTYSSRAWKTFATFNSTSESNVAGAYVSRLTGGKIYRTDVSDKYVLPRLRAETISGSRAVRSSLTSWLSLSAEVGLPGLLLMTTLYGVLIVAVLRRLRRALRRPTDGATTSLLLAAGTGLFVLMQMGFLENWLEVSRVTFLTVTLAAVAIKEFDRQEAQQ